MNINRIMQTALMLGMLAFVPSLARAEVIPQLPHIFYGTATMNNAPIVVGAKITARLDDGTAVGTITLSQAGTYAGQSAYDAKLLVQGDIIASDTIHFFSSGVEANQSAEFESGKVEELNLTFTLSGGATITDNTVESSAGNDVELSSETTGAAEMPSGTSNIALADDTVLDLSSGMSSKSEVDNSITIDGATVDLSNFTSASITTAVDLTQAQTIGDTSVAIGKAVKLKSGSSGTAIKITNAAVSSAQVEISDNTTVMAPTGWAGTIQPPKTGSSTGTAPSGFSVSNTVIDVGDPGVTLLFDKPVKVTLSGVTGSVAYKPSGSSAWHTITTTCDSATNPNNISFPGECAIQSGSDTIIWTYHFTSFASITATPAPSNGSSGSSYSGTPVITYVPINQSITINQGTNQTSSSTVVLSLSADRMIAEYAPLEMRIGNDSSLIGSTWITYSPSVSWTLASGTGTRTVYVQFRNKNGISVVASDSIQVIAFGESAPETQEQITPELAPEPQVLGARVYADGTLIRGTDKKIYAIKNQALHHIASLDELRRSYAGMPIIDVSDSVISGYGIVAGAKIYGIGELIRGSDKKIYAITKTGKHHVLSLEELARDYFQKLIHNVPDSVIAQY